MPKTFVAPAGCPPILAALIRQEGGVKQAATKAGVNKGTLFAALQAKRPLSDLVKSKIEAALKPSREEAAQITPDIPPFVPWSGKKVSAKVIGKGGGGKVETLKNVPEPIALLIAKFGSSRAKASAAMGFSGAGWLKSILDGERDFNEKMQVKVHAALHDLKIVSDDLGDQYDKYALKIAVCLLSSSEFARVDEIATDIFKGELVFKKSTGAGWIAIYKMTDRAELEKFKRVVKRDCKEIVCP